MPDKVRIMAVLVLYRRRLEDAVTWQTLTQQVNDRLRGVADFHLLVCDNGPLVHPLPALPDWVEYVGVHENHGLAWAYNRGLATAGVHGADWLLTLDQDTNLPADYVMRLAEKAAEFSATTESGVRVGAVVPQLVSDRERVHSPVRATSLGEQKIERSFQGSLKGDVRPFNSAALLRVAALQKTGGYDRRFWLNYLDHSVFHALQQAGYLVWIAGDLQVKHHLSLHEGRDRMTEEHFHHFSGAESAFRDLYASRFEGLVFTVRLLLRALNQKRRRDPQHFLRTTMAILKGRLFVSRKERIRRWEMEVASMAGEPRIAVQLRGPSAAMPIPVPAGE